jgi:hypothetical protein
MSIVTTLGRSEIHCAIAAFPSAASPTTTMSGSADNTSQSRFLTVNESSTTSTRIAAISADQFPDSLQKGVLIEFTFNNVALGAHVLASLPIVCRVSRSDQNGGHISQLGIRACSLDERESIDSRHFDID